MITGGDGGGSCGCGNVVVIGGGSVYVRGGDREGR